MKFEPNIQKSSKNDKNKKNKKTTCRKKHNKTHDHTKGESRNNKILTLHIVIQIPTYNTKRIYTYGPPHASKEMESYRKEHKLT